MHTDVQKNILQKTLTVTVLTAVPPGFFPTQLYTPLRRAFMSLILNVPALPTNRCVELRITRSSLYHTTRGAGMPVALHLKNQF